MKTIWDIGEAVTGSRNGAAFVANPSAYGWTGPGFSGQPPSMEDENAERYIVIMKQKYAGLLESRNRTDSGWSSSGRFERRNGLLTNGKLESRCMRPRPET